MLISPTVCVGFRPWPSDAADVTQLRPTEVIFEEWRKLRLAGVSTPQITVWNRVDVAVPDGPPGTEGDTLWLQYLARIYNNASYDDLIMRADDGRKVFFVVWFPWAINQTAVETIESNGGRNDIVVVHNWLSPSGYDPEWYSNGTWTFIAPCVAHAPPAPGLNTEEYPRFTTSINEGVPCNHEKTTNSPLGDAWTVSTQTAWSNLPFASSGKLGGLFMRKQFEDVFKDPEPFTHLFLPSFNEFTIAPVPWAANMGINNT